VRLVPAASSHMLLVGRDVVDHLAGGCRASRPGPSTGPPASRPGKRQWLASGSASRRRVGRGRPRGRSFRKGQRGSPPATYRRCELGVQITRAALGLYGASDDRWSGPG
jgi:hypothetical protein